MSPIFLGVDNALHIAENSPSRLRSSLRDGRRILLKLDLKFQNGASHALRGFQEQAQTTEARELTKAEIAEGMETNGEWGPREEPFHRLVELYQLQAKGLDELQLAAFLWASYLVGMEMPGRRALFSRLTLTFQTPARREGLLHYETRVSQLHDQFGLLSTALTLKLGGQTVASGELESFIREDTPKIISSNASIQSRSTGLLSNKTALVIGASRGLGASIAYSMCAQGATVIANYARSTTEVEQLRMSTLDLSGRLVPEQGDVGNLDWCNQMRARLTQFPKLDVLVCNACPPLLPLWIEPTAVGRIQDHINQSIALVLTPMAVFLDLVAQDGGWCVLISSNAVTAPVVDWPHYVAAKSAVEALVRVAALEYPSVKFLIVRPPRLLTDLTNTPLGRVGSMNPRDVTDALINALTEDPMEPVKRGQITYLDTF